MVVRSVRARPSSCRQWFRCTMRRLYYLNLYYLNLYHLNLYYLNLYYLTHGRQ